MGFGRTTYLKEVRDKAHKHGDPKAIPINKKENRDFTFKDGVKHYRIHERTIVWIEGKGWTIREMRDTLIPMTEYNKLFVEGQRHRK
jgi:hypothetical protein